MLITDVDSSITLYNFSIWNIFDCDPIIVIAVQLKQSNPKF